MYKRIPASYFKSYEDVYDAIILFMQECGFSIISGIDIDLGISSLKSVVTVLQDPNTLHKLVVIKEKVNNTFGCVLHFFVIDGIEPGKYLNEQPGIACYRVSSDESVRGMACGCQLTFLDGWTSQVEPNKIILNNCDLICIYINRLLIFIYVPTGHYIYSHIYNCSKYMEGQPTSGSFLIYGDFTKYHIADISDCVLLASSGNYSEFGPAFNEGAYLGEALSHGYNLNHNILMQCLLYCNPEATYTLTNNHWFGTELGNLFNATDDAINYCNPPWLLTSFDYVVDVNNDYYNYSFKVINYFRFFNQSFPRGNISSESLLNNTTVLMPLIVYGQREPRFLNNWSAIGESKLINLISLSFFSSGDIFVVDKGKNEYHKYLTVPTFTGNLSYTTKEVLESEGRQHQYKYTFLGLAIEIEAKENLLKEQDIENNIIWLNDTYRNFDRIEIVYEDNYTVEWTYDELNPLLDSEGIFNFTKDSNNLCMVYGLKNEDGESLEYKLTYTQSCKINSIIGYRE